MTTRPTRLLLALAALLAACGRSPELVRRPSTPAPALLIEDVSVLDVATGKLAPNRDVLVVGDKITTIAARGQTPPPPGNAEDRRDGSDTAARPDRHARTRQQHVGAAVDVIVPRPRTHTARVLCLRRLPRARSGRPRARGLRAPRQGRGRRAARAALVQRRPAGDRAGRPP